MIARRGFLQAVVAAIGAVSLPTKPGAAPVVVTNAAGRFEFMGPEFFDCGHQVGYALRFPDGRIIGVRAIRRLDDPEVERELKDALIAQARKLLTGKYPLRVAA